MEWQKRTFGKATPLSKLAHLEEELAELKQDLITKNPNRRLEFADCFFLLFGAANADGMTYEDICSAVEEKFKINKARDWGKPDKNGVVKHIKPKAEPVKVGAGVYLKRLLAAPFVFGLLLITHVYFVFKRTGKFVKGGGQMIIEGEVFVEKKGG